MFIVAPLTARAVWLSWIKRVFPGVDVGVCTSKTFDGAILEKPIVFGHYDIIHKWQTLRPIGTLVLDEAHLLGSFKTHRNKAAALLASRAARVIALTGTPIWNMPEDLWSLVSLLAPGGWGSFYDFANRYAAPIGTAYGTRYTGASNQAELNARLTEIMLRRRWVDCCDDLPAISRSVLVADVDQKTSNKLDILAAKLKSERSNTAGHLAAYRRQVCAVKHRVVVEEARKIMSRGEPVVVWTWHREFAEQLAWSLGAGEPDPTAFLMHGDVAADKREAVMNAWRAKPCGVLVATMAVGQVAIDLSHAMFAIFAEIDFTPAIIAQAEMRTFMSTRPMNILFVVAAHIVDQRMVRALIAKLGAQDALGVGAACEAIDALRDAIMGPQEIGDLDRLLEAMLAAA
jgi:SNF2 family DNA or RNA helicase